MNSLFFEGTKEMVSHITYYIFIYIYIIHIDPLVRLHCIDCNGQWLCGSLLRSNRNLILTANKQGHLGRSMHVYNVYLYRIMYCIA